MIDGETALDGEGGGLEDGCATALLGEGEESEECVVGLTDDELVAADCVSV